MADPRPEFSFPVDVTALPPAGRYYAIDAGDKERANVAARLGLVAVSSLKGSFDLAPRSGGIVEVTGHVDAAVTQTCVVTLAPVPALVREEVIARFTLRAPTPAAKSEGTDTDEDPPEQALGGLIDLGELSVVHLALGLDPYPRAEGAAFEAGAWAEKTGKSEADGPFAALAKFTKQGRSEDR